MAEIQNRVCRLRKEIYRERYRQEAVEASLNTKHEVLSATKSSPMMPCSQIAIQVSTDMGIERFVYSCRFASEGLVILH